jgi:hypothetical protein
MLTEQALRDRQRGAFPALRRILEGKADPDESSCMSSTDEGIGEGISRLLKTGRIVRHYAADIRQLTAASGDRKGVLEDLYRLESELREASRQISDEADRIRAFGDALERGDLPEGDADTY